MVRFLNILRNSNTLFLDETLVEGRQKYSSLSKYFEKSLLPRVSYEFLIYILITVKRWVDLCLLEDPPGGEGLLH